MTKVLAPMRKLARETNYAIIIPHHNSKSSNTYAGSTGIAGNVDNIWNITQDEKKPYKELTIQTRDGVLPVIKIHETENGLTLYDKQQPDVNTLAEEFINHFPTTTADAWTRKETAAHFSDLPETTLRLRLDEAQRAGIHPRLERVGEGTKKDPYRYFRV